VRFSPGFGADEEDLDARLNADSIELRRRANAGDRNVFVLYARHLAQIAHGNFGMSHTLLRPISELLGGQNCEEQKISQNLGQHTDSSFRPSLQATRRPAGILTQVK
jgi:hypothetical protein